MGVKLEGAVYVFVPFSDLPLNDPALRRDAHHVREFLGPNLPGADLVVDCTGCRDFRLLPVDGYGRTFEIQQPVDARRRDLAHRPSNQNPRRSPQ